MAKVISVGPPENEAERRAIKYLRDNLPESCVMIHNFTLKVGRQDMEVDLAILTPHCVYVVDIKDIHGTIDTYGSSWYTEIRGPYPSPLKKLQTNAKALKDHLITLDSTLGRFHVHAAVLLINSNAINNLGKSEISDIVSLESCKRYFLEKDHIPDGRMKHITHLLGKIERMITERASKTKKPLRYGSWEVMKELGENREYQYTDYLAQQIHVKGIMKRLRVYQTDPYNDPATRELEAKLISHAYHSLAKLPPHPNIVAVRDFFRSEDAAHFVLVIDDIQGHALRKCMKKRQLALTLERKLSVMQDVLTALNHAHTHQVIHRNLTPDAILISNENRAHLCDFEYARLMKKDTSSIGPYIAEKLNAAYQAPECYQEPSSATPASDLFSAGLLFYELLTGKRAFDNQEDMYDKGALFPIKPSMVTIDLPHSLDGWLQKLCAFDPSLRFPNASEALAVLNQLILNTQVISQTEGEQIESIDKKNLPQGYNLGQRFIIEEHLGQGSFACVYKVLDTWADVSCVLKLVLTDRISVARRLRKEFSTLKKLPEHPYVVQVVWADTLADSTPFIVFKYVEGQSVEKIVQKRKFTIENAVKLAIQVAKGLAHLHENSVYHRDIKPSNLIWTGQEVRIIDFNVAISDPDSVQTLHGTRRYIPPDLENMSDLNHSQQISRDIYALGITLYECVAGHYPFVEPHIRKNPLDPCSFEGCEDLNPSFVSFLFKAIAPNSNERFATAGAFLTDLERLLFNLRTSSTPVSNMQTRATTFSFGSVKTSWFVVDGDGRSVYKPQTIQSHFSPHMDELPRDLAERVQAIHEQQREKREKGEPSSWNGERYRLEKYVINRVGVEEALALDLYFGPSDYYTFLATNMGLDEPELRNKYLLNTDWSSPIKFFSHSFGVNLVVITSDEYIIITQRSSSVGSRYNQFNISMNEGLSKPQDHSTRGEQPDVYHCACRGLWEELGLEEHYAFDRSNIVFLSFGVDTQYAQWGLLGKVNVKRTANEIIQWRAGGVKDKWENTQVHAVKSTLDSIISFTLSNGPWAPSGLACLYHTLIHEYGHQKVNQALHDYYS